MNQQILEQSLNSKLSGRKIKSVRYMKREEANLLGIDPKSCPLVFLLDDGTQFCPVKGGVGSLSGTDLLTNIENHHFIKTY